jgi:hypothetical protein
MSIIDTVVNLDDDELSIKKNNQYADIKKEIKNYNEYQLILLYLLNKDNESSEASEKYAPEFIQAMSPIVSKHNQMLDCISKNNVFHQDSRNSIGGSQVLWDLAVAYCNNNETQVQPDIIAALQAMSKLMVAELTLLKQASQQPAEEPSIEQQRKGSGDSSDEKTSARLAKLPQGQVLSSWNNRTIVIEEVPDASNFAKQQLKSLSITA